MEETEHPQINIEKLDGQYVVLVDGRPACESASYVSIVFMADLIKDSHVQAKEIELLKEGVQRLVNQIGREFHATENALAVLSEITKDADKLESVHGKIDGSHPVRVELGLLRKLRQMLDDWRTAEAAKMQAIFSLEEKGE